MKYSLFTKSVAVLVASCFMFSILPVNAAEVSVKIPFGPGAAPKTNDTISKLKNEDTSGAGALIGLIILGACVVAAAVIIANAAEDTTDKLDNAADKLGDKADRLADDLKDKYDDVKQDLKDEYDTRSQDDDNSDSTDDTGTTE